MVFDVRVRDIDGIGGEERDWVDLEEGGDFGDLEVGVESVANEGIAGIGFGAGLDCGFRGYRSHIG